MVKRLLPVFPSDGEVATLYVGDLDLSTENHSTTTVGVIELGPDGISARAEVDRVFLHAGLAGSKVDVRVPDGASLVVPDVIPDLENEQSFPILKPLAIGDPGAVRRVGFTMDVPLSRDLPPLDLDDGSHQRRLMFPLGGWQVTLAEYEVGRHVVEGAWSGDGSADPDEFMKSMFGLISFASSLVVGTGPATGYDAQGEVVWLKLGSPRRPKGTPPSRWLPTTLWATVLPRIADGWAKIEADPDRKGVLRRAVAMTMPSHGPEVLEVRVITACATLELLGWAILQWEGWVVDRELLKERSAASTVRLLLSWAGVPADVPTHFEEFDRWRQKRNKFDGGPEVLFQVRNRVMHPPKKVADGWPREDLLIEAWQLSMEYADLVILKLLGYDGDYRTRLHLGGWHATVEPVPWALADLTGTSSS